MLTLILASLAIGAAFVMVGTLLESWMDNTHALPPESVKVELSETDNKKVEETRDLIHDKFGEDVADTIAKASNKERIDIMDEFAKDLAKLYGLDIDIDITVDDVSLWGYYSHNEKKAVFNIAALMIDAKNESFKAVVFEVIDTIIHELRHAVQHKSMSDSDFWDIGEERAKLWEQNMKNYIRAGVDPRGYASQPVEADAVTFAGAVMSEVK